MAESNEASKLGENATDKKTDPAEQEEKDWTHTGTVLIALRKNPDDDQAR